MTETFQLAELATYAKQPEAQVGVPVIVGGCVYVGSGVYVGYGVLVGTGVAVADLELVVHETSNGASAAARATIADAATIRNRPRAP